MEKVECWFCGKKTACRWTILRHRCKHGVGRYCKKDCALSDMWGPVYRKAHPMYIPGNKSFAKPAVNPASASRVAKSFVKLVKQIEGNLKGLDKDSLRPLPEIAVISVLPDGTVLEAIRKGAK